MNYPTSCQELVNNDGCKCRCGKRNCSSVVGTSSVVPESEVVQGGDSVVHCKNDLNLTQELDVTCASSVLNQTGQEDEPKVLWTKWQKEEFGILSIVKGSSKIDVRIPVSSKQSDTKADISKTTIFLFFGILFALWLFY